MLNLGASLCCLLVSDDFFLSLFCCEPFTLLMIIVSYPIGTILFSFSLFGKIIGLCMIANACFNVFILFRYPQYEDAQRNNAESEIKDFLAANPAFSQRIFEGGVQAGTEIFRSNPGRFLIVRVYFGRHFLCFCNFLMSI